MITTLKSLYYNIVMTFKFNNNNNNNNNNDDISHRFQVIAGYWSNLRFRQALLDQSINQSGGSYL